MPEQITNRMVIDAAWELYEDWYKEGKSITALSEFSGISRWSLTAHFKAREIFEDRRPGKGRNQYCSRGHDKKIYGKQEYKPDGSKNGFNCQECKRIRQRVGHKRGSEQQ